MGTKTLQNIRTDVGVDLGDTSAAFYASAQIDRAVERAVRELSRFMPRELVTDIAIGDLNITDEAWTSGNPNTTAITLGNTYIQGQTERVSLTASPNTVSVRGTDYNMNYVTGVITPTSGGNISSSTAMLITYIKSRQTVNLSTLDTNAILGIDRVEYKVGEEVQEYASWNWWGDRLTITGGQSSSQKFLAEASNIWVYYWVEHTAPAVGAVSTYPDHLEETVIKGTAAFCLFARASLEELQSRTDLNSARTALGNIAALHSAIATRQTALTAIHTAIDTVITAIGNEHAAFDTSIALINSTADNIALPAAVTTAWDAANVVLDSSSYNQVVTALAAANTALDARSVTNMETALSSAATAAAAGTVAGAQTDVNVANPALGNALTIVDVDMEAAFTEANKYLNDPAGSGSAAQDAEDYLDAGDAFLNTVNTGENVAGNYLSYARAAIDLANAYNAKAQIRVAGAQAMVAEATQLIIQERLNVDEANAHAAISAQYVAQSSVHARGEEARIQQAATFIGEAQGHINSEDSKIARANAYLTEAQSRGSLVNEAQLNQLNGYVSEAAHRQQKLQARLDEVTLYLTEADRYIIAMVRYEEQIQAYQTDATVYQASSAAQIALAFELRAQGESLRAEFFQVLRERQGMRRTPIDVSVNQPQ